VFGGRSADDLMVQFKAAHLNPWNRALHAVGIPTLFLSGGLWLLSPFIASLWVWPAILMPLGFGCQFLGHWIEGNRPEVFSDWRFFFVGTRWWWLLVTGRA
jgi:uncharacterized membrane protein YGL010W